MAKFSYTAIDRGGKQKTGKLEASSSDAASSKLAGMGLMVTALQEVAGGKSSSGARRSFSFGAKKSNQQEEVNTVVKRRACNSKQLSIFTRQLATLLQSGLPLLRSLEVMLRQERLPLMRRVLTGLVENVKTGNNLSEGLSQYPKTFDRLFVNMVKAGEAGGVLDVVLSRLARFMEKANQLKSKVKSAMIYPAVVITAAIVIVTGLMVFVVPTFEEVFATALSGATMPAPTQIVIDTSRYIKENALVVIAAAIGLVFAISFIRKVPSVMRVWHTYVLRVPIIGPLIMKATVARFARTFGTLLSSGVPILQALTITRDTVGNIRVQEALTDVHERVRDGESVAAPLERSNVFPTMVTSMIEVGEETAELPEMLNRIADTYDDEVDNAVSGLTAALEPAMIVVLACIVGFIVIALFLPILEIMNNIGN